MQRIALVDDDRNILSTLSMLLESEGYSVDAYADPQVALCDMRRRPPDLAVLDVRMPRMDGFDVLTRLRAVTDIPVMMLSAQDSENDEVLGLGLGADDYLRKPFSGRVMLERMRSCLRRARLGVDRTDPERMQPALQEGPLWMDPNCHKVTWHGRGVTLTAIQFAILRYLAERPDFVRSRAQVMAAVFGPDTDHEPRSVDSQIKRLRQRFQEVDPGFAAIESLYGLGYKFVAPLH